MNFEPQLLSQSGGKTRKGGSPCRGPGSFVPFSSAFIRDLSCSLEFAGAVVSYLNPRLLVFASVCFVPLCLSPLPRVFLYSVLIPVWRHVCICFSIQLFPCFTFSNLCLVFSLLAALVLFNYPPPVPDPPAASRLYLNP